jgi:hypothetical protein
MKSVYTWVCSRFATKSIKILPTHETKALGMGNRNGCHSAGSSACIPQQQYCGALFTITAKVPAYHVSVKYKSCFQVPAPWVTCYVITAYRLIYNIVQLQGCTKRRTVRCIFYKTCWKWPPLWSSGQSSWLQIQRSEFDPRRYQIFWEVVSRTISVV